MSPKSSTEVIIGGKMYTLSGHEGEEYLQRVAAYINNKINAFNDMDEIRRYPADMKAVLVELNIADDFFKAKDRVEKLEQDLELKEKELYDLKYELIAEQTKTETNDKAIKELELQNKELLLQKDKLEAALEDALLGEKDGEKGQDAQKPAKPAVSDTKKSRKK